MGVPQVYRSSSEAVATYDYFDSISGAAFIKYYLTVTYSGDTPQYTLTTDSSLHSDYTGFRIQGAFDLDFDLLVDIPFTMAARECLISWAQENTTASALTWTIIHYDGSTETVLGTVTGKASSSGSFRRSSKVTLTRQVFKRGDTLRISVSAPSSAITWAYFDPAGSTEITEPAGARTLGTAAYVFLPIVIPR